MEKASDVVKTNEFWQQIFVNFKLETIEKIPEPKNMLDNVVPTYLPLLGPELNNIFGVG